MNDAANELYPPAGIDCRDPLIWNIQPAERGRYVLPSHVVSTEIDDERGYGDVSPHRCSHEVHILSSAPEQYPCSELRFGWDPARRPPPGGGSAGHSKTSRASHSSDQTVRR